MSENFSLFLFFRGQKYKLKFCFLIGCSYWRTLLLPLAAQAAKNSAAQKSCPYPAVNTNCQVNIVAQAPAVPLLSTEFLADEYSSLKPDTQATYKCDHGYELLGSEHTTCLPSGRWSSSPPYCVTNIALGKPTNQSSTVRGGESKNANDGKLINQHDSRHCTETKVDQSPWWQIDLLQVYEIRLVRLLGRACCNPQMSLHDIEIRVGNSSSLQGNRLCAWNPNNIEEGVAKDFQCAHPILGRFVSIQMVGIESALSLCEVMVLSTKEFPAERCNIQATLAPSNNKPQSVPITTTTTTSATTTFSSSQQQQQQSADNQVIVFNRTCYETQATNGGSFLVADTYCKARGGSLLHSVNELTQSFISQELERIKPKLKSKLVWLGAKRENASPNNLGPITAGSSSALLASDTIRVRQQDLLTSAGRSALHEMSIETLFAPDQGLMVGGETSPIFSPLKLRHSLLQASTGAGGSTSRGSQTFGLQTSSPHHHSGAPLNRTVEHTGRSLIITNPNQLASSFFQPPVPVNSQSQSVSVQPSPPSPPQPSSSGLFASGSSTSSVHAPHRSLRPPALVSLQSAASSATHNNLPGSSLSSSMPMLASVSPSSSSPSGWRWVGDNASDTLQAPVSAFMWADDQPNNYNNQQDCIVLDGAKRWLWNDVTCELDYLPWVCQYRPSGCGSPDRHENSTIIELMSDNNNGEQFQLGKSITYACPIGHKMVDGARTRRCLYDGTWSGRAPRCQYVDCGPVVLTSSGRQLDNGRIVYLNQSQTTYASHVKYICNEDYVLVGDDTRQCQADGRWAGKQPYCAYKWCPVLQPIANGALNVTGQSENSIASYRCQSGYKLIGNDTRQCLLGGKWTQQEPFCQYVDCGQPKQIANANYHLLNGTTNYLSVVEYTCHENYTLTSGTQANKMICSHNNRWTGREPHCTLIDCGQPQALPGSRFIGDSYSVHSSVEYRCDPGFKEVGGSSQRTCAPDGQWTGQPLLCKYVDCGRVPAILKGEVNYTNGTTYLASQVSYDCTPGNRISGHRVRFCAPDGRWTGTSPKCEEVRCEAPELPANGSAIYIGNDRSFKEQSFSVGVTVQYECDYGHVVTGSWSSRLCQANGEWSGEPPVCKFVDCGPAPSIDNGQFALRQPPGVSLATAPAEIARRSDAAPTATTTPTSAVGPTAYGAIAHYSCEPNYKLQGPAQRECLETGQWRRPLPVCEPVQCPRPEFFDEFTQVSLLQRNTDNVGQALSGRPIKLIAGNQWINHEYAPNGQANQSGQALFAVGDKVQFACTPGYELYGGPETRTCTQYGQWSGSSTPRCRPIDCGRPAPIGQEGRYYLLNESTAFNSLVEYTCVRPYKLVEVRLRLAGNLIETLTNAQAGVTPILTALPIGVKVCANNGQWMPNDQQPKCVAAGGTEPTIGTSGQFDGSDNTLDQASQRNNRIQQFGARIPGNGDLGQGGTNSAGAASNSLGDATESQRGQPASSTPAGSLWAKLTIAFCMLFMLALIILTLICIRSGKRPKSVAQRASILHAANGHQAAAAAAAAAMQLQLSAGKSLATHHQHNHHEKPPAVSVASSLLSAAAVNNNGLQQQQQPPPHQTEHNIYINGLQKLFPGSMLGQSQMSAAGLTQRPILQTSTNQTGELGASAEPALDRLGSRPGKIDYALQVEAAAEQQVVSACANNAQAQLSQKKTIRHNPNGLVTFVSPAQQQNASRQPAPAISSSSSGVSSTSQHHRQVSPQSISTSLSVNSSSSSPSSSTCGSSSSAHHTSATRLSDSSTSAQQQHQQLRIKQLVQQQQDSEYQAPQPIYGAARNASQMAQPSPPSLPAQPPPPHRVQQHHKQLMKHRVGAVQHVAAQNGVAVMPRNSAPDLGQQQQQQQHQTNGNIHYKEPDNV